LGVDRTQETRENNNGYNGNDVIIGHLPLYNKRIDPRRVHRTRMGNNITQYTFAPISYKVAWSKLGSQGLGGKFFEVQRDVPLQKFKRTQLANNISNVADTITVLATGDSTHNETLTNDYGFGKLMSMLNDIRQNSKVQLFKEIKDLATLGGADVYTDDIREKVLNTGGGTFETLLSTAMGLQLSLPKVWTKSSYTNTVTLSTKLIAPSGSPRDVYDYIVDPLKYLLLLGSPTTSNGLVSGYPYLFEVVSAGNLFMKTAVVTSLTINRGGADSVFNIYRHPILLKSE